MTQDWLTIFDLKYINDKMLGGLRRASGKIEDYCEKLAVKAFSLSQVSHKPVKQTAEALLYFFVACFQNSSSPCKAKGCRHDALDHRGLATNGRER